MQEYLADRNFNADFRRSAIEFSGGEKARVVDDTRPAVHAQGFLGTGDEEDEADIRVGDNVLDRVEVIVAGSIRNEQGLVVKDLHKAGPVAARRQGGVLAISKLIQATAIYFCMSAVAQRLAQAYPESRCPAPPPESTPRCFLFGAVPDP
jgi:hypothetical protein